MMDRETMLAGMSFTTDDQRLYSEAGLSRLAQLVYDYYVRIQELYDYFEEQMLRCEADQLTALQFDGGGCDDCVTLYLPGLERSRLTYEMVLRQLQLARWHQGDLCWYGFGRSQAHLKVGDCLVRLHTKEMELRGDADKLGIPTVEYRKIYF